MLFMGTSMVSIMCPSQVMFRCSQLTLNSFEFFTTSTSDVENTTLYVNTNHRKMKM